MSNLKKIIYVLSFSLLNCCATTPVNSKTKPPPTKSFVKILHTINISSCKEKFKEKCPIGEYSRSGSGMAIFLEKNKMTVVTAGHVCDAQPDPNKIDKFTQVTNVIDFNGRIHQAWKVHHSFLDGVGSSDHCLLWVPTLEVPKIKVAQKTPTAGERVRYLGAPLGVYHYPTVAIFEGIFSGIVDASSSLVTFPAIGGASGSAVLNTDGEIIGILFASTERFHHLTLITNHKSFLLFISKAKNKLKQFDQ